MVWIALAAWALTGFAFAFASWRSFRELNRSGSVIRLK
jgi:hypothetical protein